jgi:hypothetical protein
VDHLGGDRQTRWLLARADIEAAPLDDGSILFDPRTTTFLVLNTTAGFLWEQLATPVTEQELSKRLCEHYEDVDPPEVLKDTEEAVEELLRLDVVQVASGPEEGP